MDASDRLLEFRRTGGRAAIDDYLVVDRDGHAMLRTPGAPAGSSSPRAR
jgi:hypothetical protein